MRSRRLLLIVLVIFVVAWIPRVLALDRFVTPDERKWLARSANFYQAVTHGDLANTFQREHPGVTVMWAGTLGFLQVYPEYAREAPGQFGWDREFIEQWLAENSEHTPLELLVAGRRWITIWIAAALALSYLPLRRLLGDGLAFVAILLVVLTPFHIALSRQLHPDGLVTALIFLSLTSFLVWLYAGREPRYLVLSGLAMGLAWLTKAPAILLVPFAGLLIGIELLPALRRRDTAALRDRATPLVSDAIGWGMLAVAVFVVLWPAMWIGPVRTLTLMSAEMGEYAVQHVNANYFMGRPTEDPGPFFYPVAYLFRETPITFVGLFLAVIWLYRRQWPMGRDDVVWRVTGALCTFAVVYAVVMTLGAKKFDRYLLPAFLPLTVVAALGWNGLAVQLAPPGWFRNPLKLREQASWLPAALLSGAILLQGAHAAATFPYYLTYFNPLAGGSRTAPDVLFVGWGEGLDTAARWMNAQVPDPEELRAASWYADGPLSYFFEGQSAILTNFDPYGWLDTDFVILYANQWQRQEPSPQALDWFFAREPAHVVRIDGLDLAYIYDMRDAPLPDFIDMDDERRADFGGTIRLSAHRLEQHAAHPGDRFRVTFYLQSIADMSQNYNVLAQLVGPGGEEVWRSEGWPWGAPTDNWPLREIRPDGHEIVIPDDAPAGLYTLQLSFYDPDTLEQLTVTEAGTDQSTGETARAIELIRVGPNPSAERSLQPAPEFGEVAALRGVTLPATVAAGEALPLDLLWESLNHTPDDYTVFVHVVGPNGEIVAQQDRYPLDGRAPTHLWDPGEQVPDPYTIPLPADAPAGTYEIRVGLYTQDGRLPVSTGGDFATVGSVDIVRQVE